MRKAKSEMRTANSEQRKANSVLITGASGFIGSHLVEEGLARGYQVYAAVRKSSSLEYLQDPRINIITLDFSSIGRLKANLIRCREKGFRFDYIIHNAGITKAGREEDYKRINVHFTEDFVEALMEMNMIPEKFIFMSSLAACGPGDPQTMDPISPDDEPSPIDAYGKSKREAELILSSPSGFPYLIFRSTGVYGPRERDYFQYMRSLKRGLELYIGSKEQRLSFIYIKDLVRLIFESLTSAHIRKVWLVSDGKSYTSEEFASIVKSVLQTKTRSLVIPVQLIRTLASAVKHLPLNSSRIPYLNHEKLAIMTSMNWQCDSSALNCDFGFTAEYDLQHGIRETLNWYNTHQWL